VASRLGDAVEESEEQIYRAHQPELDNAARFTGTPPGDREDATQDTWVRVLQHRRSTHKDAQLVERPWLHAIVRNLARDRWRRNQRSARAVQRLASREAAASSGDAVDEIVLAHVEGELVRQAFARLTQAQRQVLQLRVIEGLSAAEVGAALGKEAAAVRQMQFRALVALRSELLAAGWQDDGGEH
jgi:RNA polymerase sigma-70 factor (ECF subfamily)